MMFESAFGDFCGRPIQIALPNWTFVLDQDLVLHEFDRADADRDWLMNARRTGDQKDYIPVFIVLKMKYLQLFSLLLFTPFSLPE
jgi:hypothetical protein